MPKAKVSVTVDPELLQAIDRFLADHPDTDRSQVFDQALRLWYEERQRSAMLAQYAEGEESEQELAAWRAIRRAAAERRWRPE